MVCDSLGSVRSSSGEDRAGSGRLGASPEQLEPSHTLLDTHHLKPVRSNNFPLKKKCWVVFNLWFGQRDKPNHQIMNEPVLKTFWVN